MESQPTEYKPPAHLFALEETHKKGENKSFGSSSSQWAQKPCLPGITFCFGKVHRPVFPHFHQQQKSEPRWSSIANKRRN